MTTCAMEIESPDRATLGPALSRPNVFPMAHLDCRYDKPKGENWDRWIDEQCDKAIDQLSPLAAGNRVLHIFGGACWDADDHYVETYGTKPDGTKLSPINWEYLDATPMFCQMLRLRHRLAEAFITELDGVFIDAEQEWNAWYITKAEFYAATLAPLRCKRKMLWNHVQASPKIPSKYWAGDFWRDTIDGTSTPEAYIGWHNPADPSLSETNPGPNKPQAMWESFIRFINAARSAILCGPTVVHLPVCHPDDGVAMWYTRQVVIHTILAGAVSFNWATYMTKPELRPAMADHIDDAIQWSDNYVGRKPYLITIKPNARTVTTAGHTTRKPSPPPVVLT